MFEQAFNTIQDRTDLISNPRTVDVVKLQPTKINFIEGKTERLASGWKKSSATLKRTLA